MSKTVGLQLRQARQERGLTIEEVAQATRIRAHYLLLLEAGEFSALPSKAQARGFIRSYANFLDIDPAGLLENRAGEDSNVEQQAERETNSAVVAARPEPQPAQIEKLASASPGPIRIEQPQEIPDGSQPYFIEIGGRLQKQRELLGLTFEEIERHTRLRKHYLQALEAGDLKGLPSSVQARGMLSNYAVFLGMDPEPLLLLFAEGLQNQLAVRRAAEQPSRSQRARSKTGQRGAQFRGDLLIGGSIGLLMIAFVVWGGLRILSSRSEEDSSEPTAPSIAEVLLASATATLSPTAQPETPLPPPTLTLPAGVIVTDAVSGEIVAAPEQGNVVLQLIIQQRTWLRVVVDGQIQHQGRVVPGSALSFAGDSAIEILAGNGEAIRVIYNQQDVGSLGDYGEVVNLIFTAEGVVEPTPTVTFTPSATSLLPALPSPTVNLPAVASTATPMQGTPQLP